MRTERSTTDTTSPRRIVVREWPDLAGVFYPPSSGVGWGEGERVTDLPYTLIVVGTRCVVRSYLVSAGEAHSGSRI